MVPNIRRTSPGGRSLEGRVAPPQKCFLIAGFPFRNDRPPRVQTAFRPKCWEKKIFQSIPATRLSERAPFLLVAVTEKCLKESSPEAIFLVFRSDLPHVII